MITRFLAAFVASLLPALAAAGDITIPEWDGIYLVDGSGDIIAQMELDLPVHPDYNGVQNLHTNFDISQCAEIGPASDLKGFVMVGDVVPTRITIASFWMGDQIRLGTNQRIIKIHHENARFKKAGERAYYVEPKEPLQPGRLYALAQHNQVQYAYRFTCFGYKGEDGNMVLW